jgi:hypothetical protein
MKRGREIAILIVAVVVGYVLAVVLAPGVVAPSPTPEPGERTVSGSSTTTTVDASLPATTTPRAEVYLVWSTGGLTDDLVRGLERQFDELSVVRGDAAELDAEEGWVIPLDAVAIDPTAHRFFDRDGSLTSLRPGAVALSEASAQFRGLALGDELIVEGVAYEVTAITPDDVVGAAEVIFDRSDPDAPVATNRYALVSTDLARNEFEDVVRAMYDGPAPLRIRSRGESPWLRHGDAVLPQVFIKSALGEFAYSNLTGSEFSQDPAFVEGSIVTAEVPILGKIQCHETVVEMLAGAMGQLADEGLAHLVDPAGFAGCWNPRYIRPTTGTSSGISRHAWGAAVDLNAASNPVGSAGTQDARLVEVMLEWGFTWGGDWLVPDPMHFEYGLAP